MSNKNKIFRICDYYLTLKNQALQSIHAPKRAQVCFSAELRRQYYSKTFKDCHENAWHEWITLRKMMEKIAPGSFNELDQLLSSPQNLKKADACGSHFFFLLGVVDAFKRQYKKNRHLHDK